MRSANTPTARHNLAGFGPYGIVSVAAMSVGGLLLSFGNVSAQTLGPAVNATDFTSRSKPISPFTIQTLGTQSFKVDDNPSLNSPSGKTEFSSVTSPELVLNGDTPTIHIDSDILANLRVSSLPNFSSNDIHAKANTNYFGEKWTIKALSAIDYDTTNTSEVTTTGIDTPGIRHLGLSTSPEVGYAFSQVDKLELRSNYLASRYDNKIIFTDYEYYGVSPSYSHQLDPINTLFVSAPVTRYQATSGPAASFNNYGLLAGWRFNYSETLRLAGDAGVVQSNGKTSTVTGRSTTSSDLRESFDLSANIRTRQDEIVIAASRIPTPLGAGIQSITTAFNFGGTHHITTRLEADLAATYQFSDYSGTTSTAQSLQKSFASISPSIAYHITESLTVSAAYIYRHQETQTFLSSASTNTTVNNAGPASSNAVMLTVSFSPNAVSFR